ncbi:MAG: FKBP-type peptidyl-prolyl cis-trans isomerase [Nitrospiraceae bacterium]
MTKRYGWLVGAMVLGTILAQGVIEVSAAGELQVADGLRVTVEYTLKLSDKSVADSNVGQAPFTYTQGAHEIVPGLEKAMIGLKAGQSKRVEVPAVEGYGAYNQKARTTVERNRVPADIKPGTLLQSADGRPVRVLEVNEKTVVLDLNHPLAGKDLTFDVKVVKVEKAAPPVAEKKP